MYHDFPIPMAHALECTVHFLGEQRTEPYTRYGEGVVQLKNVLSTKSTLQRQALLDLGRCGA